ncbi:hypothetical protein BJP26_19230 [Sphingomonas melonis TY]|nr:hypothetical protein BJP26_19230 [Sphingomonas melonis TY]
MPAALADGVQGASNFPGSCEGLPHKAGSAQPRKIAQMSFGMMAFAYSAALDRSCRTGRIGIYIDQQCRE